MEDRLFLGQQTSLKGKEKGKYSYFTAPLELAKHALQV